MRAPLAPPPPAQVNPQLTLACCRSMVVALPSPRRDARRVLRSVNAALALPSASVLRGSSPQAQVAKRQLTDALRYTLLLPPTRYCAVAAALVEAVTAGQASAGWRAGRGSGREEGANATAAAPRAGRDADAVGFAAAGVGAGGCTSSVHAGGAELESCGPFGAGLPGGAGAVDVGFRRRASTQLGVLHELRNYWSRGNAYVGLNASFRTAAVVGPGERTETDAATQRLAGDEAPADGDGEGGGEGNLEGVEGGVLFEVQLHTPRSFEVKQVQARARGAGSEAGGHGRQAPGQTPKQAGAWGRLPSGTHTGHDGIFRRLPRSGNRRPSGLPPRAL